MKRVDLWHVVTVGMDARLIKNLWNPIAAKVDYRLTHILHPSYARAAWPDKDIPENIRFLREDYGARMPAADRQYLASLEGEGIPTIHNMIMSDRHVSKLAYSDALEYSTLLARRLGALYSETKPMAIIGGFDALHGSLSFAVAQQMGIPWFALNFSTFPRGRAALCQNLSPASAMVFDALRPGALREDAEKLLSSFEARVLFVPTYIQPRLDSLSALAKQLPGQLRALRRVLTRRKLKNFLKYSDYERSYSVSAQFKEACRLRKNMLSLRGCDFVEQPKEGPYAFFGLHTQPESSIDTWAHFFSNQLSVIELMSRSLPPTHTLLIKLHKSDWANYSRKQLASMTRFPGVELVAPFADTFKFINRAALVFSIQGTIGLEAALLGRPLILFGDSPTKVFPSATTIGKVIDLPRLVQQKLVEKPPSRSSVIEAFAYTLAPFYPASANDWEVKPIDSEIDGYVRLFSILESHVRERHKSGWNSVNAGGRS